MIGGLQGSKANRVFWGFRVSLRFLVGGFSVWGGLGVSARVNRTLKNFSFLSL